MLKKGISFFTKSLNVIFSLHVLSCNKSDNHVKSLESLVQGIILIGPYLTMRPSEIRVSNKVALIMQATKENKSLETDFDFYRKIMDYFQITQNEYLDCLIQIGVPFIASSEFQKAEIVLNEIQYIHSNHSFILEEQMSIKLLDFGREIIDAHDHQSDSIDSAQVGLTR